MEYFLIGDKADYMLLLNRQNVAFSMTRTRDHSRNVFLNLIFFFFTICAAWQSKGPHRPLVLFIPTLQKEGSAVINGPCHYISNFFCVGCPSQVVKDDWHVNHNIFMLKGLVIVKLWYLNAFSRNIYVHTLWG